MHTPQPLESKAVLHKAIDLGTWVRKQEDAGYVYHDPSVLAAERGSLEPRDCTYIVGGFVTTSAKLSSATMVESTCMGEMLVQIIQALRFQQYSTIDNGREED
jgi:hypothetical protein